MRGITLTHVDQVLFAAFCCAYPYVNPEDTERWIIEEATAIEARVPGGRPAQCPVTPEDRRLLLAAALRRGVEIIDGRAA